MFIMNWITETKSFYDWLETNTLPTSAIALWHALMYQANKTGWKKEFAVASSVLAIRTGLHKDTIKDVRNRLAQAGRLTFRSRGGNQSAVYTLIPFAGDFARYETPQQTLQEPPENLARYQTPQVTPQQTPQVTPINKLNQTKQNETKEKRKNTLGDLQSPTEFDSDCPETDAASQISLLPCEHSQAQDAVIRTSFADPKAKQEAQDTAREQHAATPATAPLVDPKAKALDDFFDGVWKLYPKKQGKGKVSKTQRLKLFKIGYDQLAKCVERYKRYIAKEGVSDQYTMHGSTFFNSGYVDYLDENYDDTGNGGDTGGNVGGNTQPGVNPTQSAQSAKSTQSTQPAPRYYRPPNLKKGEAY